MTTENQLLREALQTIKDLMHDRLFTAEWASKHGATVAKLEAALTQPAPPASQEQAQQPSEDVRELSKWLNEETSAPINRQALARVLAVAQQPSGGEVKAAPVGSYPAQDQAFYAFWYSHMKGDLMQPPLADISHSTARYIWDSALATPKPEPMTDEQALAINARYLTCLECIRATEAHHGITKEQA